MLRDLDSLMRERGLDALIVPLHEAMHPSFRWLSRGAKLLTYPMEREEEAASGLISGFLVGRGNRRTARRQRLAIDEFDRVAARHLLISRFAKERCRSGNWTFNPESMRGQPCHPERERGTRAGGGATRGLRAALPPGSLAHARDDKP
ncbi:MAG TPA: hypothetical protein VNA69_24780 [Thermoanaerobaculia bacterium]|nr:hypothetical protein [Thermoanaerobaculia bacterium]